MKMFFRQPEYNLTPEEVLDYLRKSQSDDPLLTVEEVLEKHETILDEWAEKHLGGKVPEKNKFREVVSGETMKERPGILQVLRLIESPKIKAVAVVEPQRLTRGDGEEIGRLMKLFKFTHTLVITPQRIYDLSDDYDWDALKRELERGNDYLNYTKKILNRGLLLSVAAGNYVGNVPPYGYDKTTVMDGKRKCPTLKINPEQANVMQMIFDMYVNKDMGRHKICRYLDSMGIKPPRGKHWSPETMNDMLSNVHYIGKVRWNWRKTMNIVEEGEIKKTRPKLKIGEYLIYDGKHPAIISDELFNAAQEKKGRNPRAKPDTKIRNPLASILYCKCGRSMSLRTYKAHNGKPRLLCDGQVHCNTGSCLYDEMINKVCEILEQCIEDFEIRLTNDTGDSAKLHAKLIKSLEKKLVELEKRELAQWNQQSHPDPEQRMPVHIFKQLNSELIKEREEINQALCKAQESMPEPMDYEEKIVRFKDALEALKNPDVDAQTKNTLLKRCIERIEYHRDKPERTQSQKVTFYDKEQKRTRQKSPLKVGGNWTNPPIELDVKLKV
jgi:hypothetical protein